MKMLTSAAPQATASLFTCPPDALRLLESGDRRKAGCGVCRRNPSRGKVRCGTWAHKLPQKRRRLSAGVMPKKGGGADSNRDVQLGKLTFYH